MRVAFHTNQLNVRGTSVSVFDYAHHNRTLLGNDSIVLYERRNPWNQPAAVEHFSGSFALFPYDDFSEVDGIMRRTGSEVLYLQKYGVRDGKVNRVGRCAIHAVFQAHEPHGDVYAYISEWLSQKMTGGKAPFVPYMVRLPPPARNLRATWGVPEDAVVFGRHGGADQFDLDFVHRAVARAARERRDVRFVFMNTDPFCEPLPNILHVPGTTDLQAKSDFINSCDAMVHGRNCGESFGLAIAEFLLCGKPVLSWREGIDRNHTVMVRDKSLFYGSEQDLFGALMSFDPRRTDAAAVRSWVAAYSPEAVMRKFFEVFLA